jgi:hypothetical protein
MDQFERAEVDDALAMSPSKLTRYGGLRWRTGMGSRVG